MTDEERLADLKAKLKERESRPGYEANVVELRLMIADLEGDPGAD